MKTFLLGLVLGFLATDAWWVYRRAPELIQREIARVFRTKPGAAVAPIERAVPVAPAERAAERAAEPDPVAPLDAETSARYIAVDAALHTCWPAGLPEPAQELCNWLVAQVGAAQRVPVA